MRLFLAIIFLPSICFSQTADSLYSFKYLNVYLRLQKKTYKLIGTENKSQLKTLENSYTNLGNFKGKKLIVDTWYGDCGPCFRQIPFLEKVKEIFRNDTNIAFINVCSETSDGLWRKRIKEEKITGLNLLDERMRSERRERLFVNEFNLDGWPQYAFINNDSKFQGATYIKPESFILFAYFVNEFSQGHSLKEVSENFKLEIKSKSISPPFKKFLVEKLAIKEDDIPGVLEVYRPFFK